MAATKEEQEKAKAEADLKAKADAEAKATADVDAAAAEAERGLVRMIKDGQELSVHPTCVQGHRERGWHVKE